jgi:DNA polymerase V
VSQNTPPIQIVEIYTPLIREATPLPQFVSGVQAGFPSPADDFVENQLDLNQLMVPHPTSTFFVRVEGDSMRDAGINNGDTLVVDRSLVPVSGKIIVAIINGEFTVKRFITDNKGVYLMPENKNFPTLKIAPDSDFQVWGVVTYVIHKAQ